MVSLKELELHFHSRALTLRLWGRWVWIRAAACAQGILGMLFTFGRITSALGHFRLSILLSFDFSLLGASFPNTLTVLLSFSWSVWINGRCCLGGFGFWGFGDNLKAVKSAFGSKTWNQRIEGDICVFDLGLLFCCSGVSQYKRSFCFQFSIFKGEIKPPIVVTFWLSNLGSRREERLRGLFNPSGNHCPLAEGLGFGVQDPQIPALNTGRGFTSLSSLLGAQLQCHPVWMGFYHQINDCKGTFRCFQQLQGDKTISHVKNPKRKLCLTD